MGRRVESQEKEQGWRAFPHVNLERGQGTEEEALKRRKKGRSLEKNGKKKGVQKKKFFYSGKHRADALGRDCAGRTQGNQKKQPKIPRTTYEKATRGAIIGIRS